MVIYRGLGRSAKARGLHDSPAYKALLARIQANRLHAACRPPGWANNSSTAAEAPPVLPANPPPRRSINPESTAAASTGNGQGRYLQPARFWDDERDQYLLHLVRMVQPAPRTTGWDTIVQRFATRFPPR